MEGITIFNLIASGAIVSAVCFTGSIKKNLKLANRMRETSENTSIRIESLPDIMNETVYLNARAKASLACKGVTSFIYKFKSLQIDLSTLYKNSVDSFNNVNEDSTVLDSLISKRALLEFASTRRVGNVKANGLMRIRYDEDNKCIEKIGFALNDGYRKILLARLNNTTPEDSFECNIARFIELILGEHEMMQMFFDGALDRLIDGLGEYSSKKTAIRTIREFDHVYEAMYTTKSNIVKSLSKESYWYLLNYLISMMRKKLLRLGYSVDKDSLFDIQDTEYTEYNICRRALLDLIGNSYKSGLVYFEPRLSEIMEAERQITTGGGFAC